MWRIYKGNIFVKIVPCDLTKRAFYIPTNSMACMHNNSNLQSKFEANARGLLRSHISISIIVLFLISFLTVITDIYEMT